MFLPTRTGEIAESHALSYRVNAVVSTHAMNFQFCDSIRSQARLAPMGATNMKDLYQVLRQKELDLERLRQEIEALRFVTPLLADDPEADLAARPLRVPAPPARRAGNGD